MLQVNGLSFNYGSTQVLNDVSLQLAAGQVLALLGPNGAGKSTLVSLLTGARKPTTGSVLLNDKKLNSRRGCHHRIGWVPQSITLFQRLTVIENLRVMGRIMGVKRAALADGVEQALELTGLNEKRYQRADTLSGGQQRLLNIGMALVHNPQLLILDEPTAGVDRNAGQQLKRMIRSLRARGLAILLTTHELEDASELADRLLILVDGVIRASGATDAVIESVFKDQRQVSVWLASGAPHDRALQRCRERLGEAGLTTGDIPEQWAGLMDNGQQQVDTLMHELLTYGERVREVRVRNPSLDLLIGRVSATGSSS